MRLHRTLPWRQVRRYSASRELSQLPKVLRHAADSFFNVVRMARTL